MGGGLVERTFHCSIVDNTLIFIVHGASADHLAQQAVVVGYEVYCVVKGAAALTTF